ncbi:hypothetical protein Tco_0065508 [Tanacetum coccineum]
MSDKECPEVEITNDKEVKITNVVIPVNVNEEEEEITDEVHELKRMEKGKIEVMVESLPTMVDKHIKEQVEKQVLEQVKVQVLVKLQAKISSQIQNAIDTNIPSLVDASVRSYMSRHILHIHPAQLQTTSVLEQQYQLYLPMKDDPQLQQQDIAICLVLQIKFETLQNSAKRQKTSEYEAHVIGESSRQVNENEQGQSSSRNQEQTDDYDFWTKSYALDDDKILMKQVLQDIMEEVSLAINEAELKKIADEMLRQRCASRDEHQYHIDQMKNFLKSDIVWESKKEILASPYP